MRVGWARRTTTIDVHRDDLYGAGTIDARARDAYRPMPTAAASDSRIRALDHAHLRGDVAADNTITALSIDSGTRPPPAGELAALIGARTNAGFRRQIATTQRAAAPGTLWHVLVDDFVGAVLVSGVAPQHLEAKAGGGPIEESAREFADLMKLTMSDLCSGWASDASMLRVFDDEQRLPVACGPAAPALFDRSDEDVHQVAPLGPNDVRRFRRIDVAVLPEGGLRRFDAHFRDSHVDDLGTERCVHEYSLNGALDAATNTIAEIEATAHVLPWTECPGALVSPQRIVGVNLDSIRDTVRSDFRGVSTCTHLNDTIRSLADLNHIIERADQDGAAAASNNQPTTKQAK